MNMRDYPTLHLDKHESKLVLDFTITVGSSTMRIMSVK